ncbi:hypothetical protein GH714_003355 [Hevea brasiliensis]|uniref:Uncharacterized protein n=1 Tax=Hevea brasiliensis TaxID=3981 RepID=A0A6A6LXZ5_HEVBR|nr:hypothetical protein GH714_003355 [Hevea brasiliensis]
MYKLLFVICLAVNITGPVLAATGHFPHSRRNAALFSIANFFASTLSRNEIFWWVVFWLAVNVFGRSWKPLRFKTCITSLLQSPGGMHSNCGISSIEGVKAGVLGRISPSPLSELHGFGIISDGKTEHMMLVGAVGDYTKHLITNPPNHLANWCFIWVAKGIEQSFGIEIKEMVSSHPKDKVIVHDSALLGRPDVSQMRFEAAKVICAYI